MEIKSKLNATYKKTFVVTSVEVIIKSYHTHYAIFDDIRLIWIQSCMQLCFTATTFTEDKTTVDSVAAVTVRANPALIAK